MKMIINTSNLYVGGGLQVAISFINELMHLNKNHEYYIFLSPLVKKQIEEKNFSNNFHFYLIEKSPSSLKTRRKVVKKLDNLENDICPDIVFSIFGPSYWKPKSKHIMGFAVPWLLQKESVAYNELTLDARIKMRSWVEYISYYTKRDASEYIIETSDGKERLSKVLGIEKNNISVVGNSYSSIFDNQVYLSEDNPNYIKLPVKETSEFRLLLISHNHPHKNLKIINKVLPLLRGYNIKFILTIDDSSFKALFQKNEKQILNIGPVKQKSCPSLYQQCDALFLPTLLEVFSASYPEAMKTEKPILTSNYSFATDICADAALYFDPLDPKDIAEKVKKLVDDKSLQNNLVAKGKKRVKEFETARSRAEKYIALCEKIVKLEI